ncbi:uncharacterized protein L199_002419 [Kwoniella botswanensis]|uniref:uncharacterized protein n=1 Tax=Kwoniella botswanensis TaxID=1268659 RepID=UPI00315CE961
MSSEDTSYPCDITAEKFQKLHPVHYRIFDLLKKEIPVTLIQTCHQMYDELIPKLYERIIITEENYDSITGGASIELQEWYLEEREEMAEQEGISEEELEQWDEDLPDLKDKALSHTTFLSFTDIRGATRFLNEITYCDDGCCEPLKYHLRSVVFPNVKVVHLGKDVVKSVVDYHVDEDLFWSTNAGLDHRMAELLDVVYDGREPYTICIDWPEDWNQKDWPSRDEEEDVDDDDEEEYNVDWALEQGMKKFLLRISSFECVQHIVIHLNLLDLYHLVTGLKDITHHSDLTFYLTIDEKNRKRFHNHAVLEVIYDHFRYLSYKYDIEYLPIRYSLPILSDFAKSVEDYGEDVNGEEAEIYDILKERLGIREEECECRIK